MALIQYQNEYGRLRKIALYRPSTNEVEQEDADSAMYISIPNADAILKEFDAIVQKFIDLGVEVIVLEPNDGHPITSNMIYLRDVAFTFRDKLVLANMKHSLRQQEPYKFKVLLSSLSDEYSDAFLKLPSGAYMEGADIFAISPDLLYAYVGSRTSESIADELNNQFPGVEVRNIEANIHGVPQHILGGVHILDESTATRRIKFCKDSLEGYSFIDFEEDEETGKGFSLNIVTLRPREILMPANRSKTKAKLESQGITCHEVEINEIHKMGGGLACMVLPLWRD